MLEAMLNLGLDELDYKILKLLEKDGRMSFAKIGREINLSRTTVWERVAQMQEKGIIERFSVIINPKAVGLNLSVFFEIECMPSKLLAIAGDLSKNEYILSVNQMTGRSMLHVHAALASTSHMESFLKEIIYSKQGITSVNSYVLLRGIKSKSGGIKIN